MLELSPRQAAPPGPAQADFFDAPPGPVHKDSSNDAEVAFFRALFGGMGAKSRGVVRAALAH